MKWVLDFRKQAVQTGIFEDRETNEVSPVIITAYCLESFQPIMQKETTKTEPSSFSKLRQQN